MFVAGEVSYFSRFTQKFVEIIAAGIATAISGYLVAHLSGYLSSPMPTAAVQTAPSASATRESPQAQQRDAAPPVAQSAAAPVNAAHPAPARKPAKVETGASEGKPHEAAKAKAIGMESIEAEVRAALADAGANHPAPPHRADVLPGPPAAAAQPRPVEGALGGFAAIPRAAATPQPAQQTPVEIPPSTPVEIRSLPVAGVEPSPPPFSQPEASAAGDGKATDHGLFSAFENIPNLLRSDTSPPAGDAPRPPLPVGQ
jgi:hypothetical protein